MRSRRAFKIDRDVEEWHGEYVRYDIVKEFVAAFLAVLALVLLLSILLSSPDERPITITSWSTNAPLDFAATAITELDGTSPTATYGPPYNNTPGVSQAIGPVSLASFFGVHHPINTAADDVIDPLETLPGEPRLDAAIATYEGASPRMQQQWTGAFEKGIAKASFRANAIDLPAGNYGPVSEMIAALTSMARSGALDGALTSPHQFYGTDYTTPLLFIADGSYMASVATAQHLSGTQWGMMNETGNYPGQAWLWLYTMWYQVPPFSTSSNGDALVWALMMVLTLLLVLVPFLPGLRSIPRLTGIYRLIWRQHYRTLRQEG